MTDTNPEMTYEPVETGLAGLELGPGTNLSLEPLHPNLDPHQIARLARQMVIAAKEPDLILRSEEISQAQFERFVKPTELYQRVYNTFLLEWQSPMSTNKRIAIISATLLEDSLIDIATRMVDANTPFTSAIEAAKALAKFAGIGEQTATQSLAPSERFIVNIITSAEKVSVAESPQSGALPTDAQRQSNPPPILLESKRASGA